MTQQQLGFIRHSVAIAVLARDHRQARRDVFLPGCGVQLSAELAQSDAERIMGKLVQVLRWAIKFDRKVTSGATVEISCEKAAVMTGQRRFVNRCRKEHNLEPKEKSNGQRSSNQETRVFNGLESSMANVHALDIIYPARPTRNQNSAG